MWRVLSVFTLAVALTLGITGKSSAASSQFDGLWEGEARLNCGAGGDFEIRIENGELSGKARMKGMTRGTYRISGRVEGTNLRKGRMIGPIVFGLKGGFNGDKARGEIEFDNCEGSWEATLVEPAAPVAAAPEPAPVEPAIVHESPTVEVAKAEPAAPVVSTAPETIATPAKKPVREEPVAAPERAARDDTPPTIAVPRAVAADGETVALAGIVRDDSAILDLRVDGRPVELDGNGRFQIEQVVPVGTSTLTIAALDEWGNETQRIVEVTRARPVAPEPAPVERVVRTSEGGDTEPPVIATPATLKTDEATVALVGRVDDASTVVQFMINDRPAPLTADGRFEVQRAVPLGESAFRVSAIDEWGNQTEIRVNVIRDEVVVETGRYFALVIGNNDYDAMPALRTAVADAEAISGVLTQRYGFAVTQLHNATRYDVLKALSNFRKELRYEDNLLIYYAGHGVVDPVTERGYWLPVDAEESLQANWISNADITDSLKAIAARHVLVIADSCYSGILTRDVPIQLETFEDRRAWIERVVEKRSRTAFSSGGLEPVADGGGGQHSIFAKSLLDVLRNNTRLIDAATLFLPVRKQVVLNANQTPQYADIRLAGHEGGDFVFAPR
jgi:hypothetical protein